MSQPLIPDRISKVIRDHLYHEFGLEKVRLSVQSGSKNGDSYSGDVFRVIVQSDRACEEGDADDDVRSLRADVVLANNPHLQFIVKISPTNKLRRELHNSSRHFRREYYTYLHILPAFEHFQLERLKNFADIFNNYPNMIAGSSVPNYEYVLLEDLTTYGFHNFDKPVPLSFEKCTAIVKSLARFHAISFAYKDKRPEEFLKLTEPLDEIVFKVPVHEQFDEFLKKTVDNAMGTLSDTDEEVKQHMLQFQMVFSESMVQCVEKKDDAIILHGDCWISNILYRDNPKSSELDIYFLDWQVSRYGSPAIDLSYFIFCCTDSEVRARLPEVLKIYHDALTERISALGSDPEALFPFDKLEMHMKSYAKFGLGMALMTLHTTSCDSNEMPNVIELLDSMDFSQLKDVTNMLIGKEAYKKRMSGVCRDMFKLGYI